MWMIDQMPRAALLGGGVAIMLSMSSAAIAADGSWAGSVECMDHIGSIRKLEIKAQLTGNQLAVDVNGTTSNRAVDSKGIFSMSVMVQRRNPAETSVGRMLGKITPAAIVLKADGGQSSCSGTLN